MGGEGGEPRGKRNSAARGRGLLRLLLAWQVSCGARSQYDLGRRPRDDFDRADSGAPRAAQGAWRDAATTPAAELAHSESAPALNDTPQSQSGEQVPTPEADTPIDVDAPIASVPSPMTSFEPLEYPSISFRPDTFVSAPSCDSAPALDGGEFSGAILGERGASVVADFNGDSMLDLVLVIDGGEQSSVLLGRGDGTFLPALPGPRMADAGLLRAADVSADGIVDLIFGGTWNNRMGVLLGNGDGSFEAAQLYKPGGIPADLVTGDWNGDELVDIAASSEQLGVMLSNGDGSVTWQERHEFPGRPRGLATGDVNSDGFADLLVAHGGISVLLGTGTGAFTEFAQAETTDGGISALVTSDLDLDGDLDLIAAGECVRGFVSGAVLLGAGDGTFSEVVDPGWHDCVLPTVLDGDGDGYPDLTGPGGLLSGLGDGTFAADTISLPPGDFADWNADGVLDRASIGLGGRLQVFLGADDGSYRLAGTAERTRANGPIVLRDFDGDDSVDLVSGSGDGNGFLLFSTSASGQLALAGEYPIDQKLSQLAAGEFNNDGWPDLVTLGDGTTATSLRAWVNGRDGGFDPPETGAQLELQSLPLIAVGSLNGDEFADTVVGHVGATTLLTYLTRADGELELAAEHELAGDLHALQMVDGQGMYPSELIVVHDNPTTQGTFGLALSILGSQNDGTFTASNPIFVLEVLDDGELSLGDFNADGRDDAVITMHGEGMLIALRSPDGGFTPGPNHAMFPGGKVALGDLNGDGDMDVVSSAHGLKVYFGDGDTGIRCVQDYGLGLEHAALGDLDADGRLDIAATWDGELGFFLNRGE